ncbi:MAG: double zinc ribbon domain-containing protein, partial [Chloroflexota bacterium]
MTGAVLGTPDFMPPEQRRDAAEVDHRSDLWSLAATVYQMVTGRSPKVIRLHELPQSLQGVLAKALEDRKDARFQSARELRDAIKGSLRIAGTGSSSTIETGQCPGCGVQNDLSRKFCRGCGASLEAPCLSCTKPLPLWEEICGSCGGKQTPLADSRRQTMTGKQVEAEGLLGDYEFARAEMIATQLRDEPHPRLRFLAEWADVFLTKVERSRVEQTQHAIDAVAEAGKHEAAYDYLSAQTVLQALPAALQAAVLPGMTASVTTMLARVKAKHSETRSLESVIKERLAAKRIDDLLPMIDRFLALQPNRRDVQKIRDQLVERAERQVAGRDQAISIASTRLAEHDYEKAVTALAGIPAAMVTPEVVRLREQAEGLLRQAEVLSGRIRNAVASKEVDGLIETVDAYLAIKPADADILRLRRSLMEREEKQAAEVTSRIERALVLEKTGRCGEAHKLLSGIPESWRNDEIDTAIWRCEQAAAERNRAIAAIKAAEPGGYEAAIAAAAGYRRWLTQQDAVDTEFTSLLAEVEDAQSREVSRRKQLRLASIAVGSVLAMVLLISMGLWIRSTVRAASVAFAIKKGSWDDALKLDPANATALVGRARAKLSATPPDVNGAFSDLEQAERQPGAMAIVEPARADAHAVRAATEARAGRIDGAGEDLQVAVRGGAALSLLSLARESIAKAWLGRAERAVEKGDREAIRSATQAALAAGADGAVVASLQAKGMVLEAVAALKQGDEKSAVARILDAWLLDAPGVHAVLVRPENASLRTAVAAEYRRRFDAAVAGNDWWEALRVA